MGRPTLRILVAATLPGVLSVFGTTGVASARPVESGQFHHESVEVVDGFCNVEGLRVRVSFTGDFAYRLSSRNGLIYNQEHVRIRELLTNLRTGETWTHRAVILLKDLHVVNNHDGTLTVVRVGSGNAVTYDARGRPIVKDPGHSRERVVYDHRGTPGNPEDDRVISVTVVKESTGRNDDFCDVTADRWG